MAINIKATIGSGFGNCAVCGKKIEKGAEQITAKINRSSSRYHKSCVEQMLKQDCPKAKKEWDANEQAKLDKLAEKEARKKPKKANGKKRGRPSKK